MRMKYCIASSPMKAAIRGAVRIGCFLQTSSGVSYSCMYGNKKNSRVTVEQLIQILVLRKQMQWKLSIRNTLALDILVHYISSVHTLKCISTVGSRLSKLQSSEHVDQPNAIISDFWVKVAECIEHLVVIT